MSDPNETRFDAIRKYLGQNFPDADVPVPTEASGLAPGHVFWVEEGYDVTQLEVRRSVYETRSVAQLVTLLEALTVAETMRANPAQRLVIASLGRGEVQCSLEELRD